ncbi:MAG: YfhO family protein [Ruminococcus sp.]|nr:YfhO family protein [Ruminococcus sp.]
MSKTKAVSQQVPVGALPTKSAEKVKLLPLYYVYAFLIPAVLTLIAYAIFGVYPFGERSVLTLDLNGQYVYYFENIRDCFWNGESPLYSWSRNLSGGYQGVIGYYLASPFTFIVILLPRSMIIESLMIMQLCKVGACGAAFFAYAYHSKKVKPFQSLIFAVMYAQMSYVAIQLIDPMWIDGPIFLPLIILGLEYLVDDGRKINYIIPLAIMFIANFYIGFMIAIFVALYFVYYLFFGANKKYRNVMDYAKTIGRMVLSTGVVLLCSYIMIMPVYNALALGKFDFSVPDYTVKTMFNPIELLPTLFPNQYYSVNVDEGTRLYGRPEIYCGVLSFVLVPLYYLNKKIKMNRKIGYSFIIVLMFISMWIKPVNMMWHGGQDPNWLPYRYSFIVSFVLVSMAAEAFSNLNGYKLEIKHVIGTFAAIAVLCFVYDAIQPNFNYNEEKYKYAAIMPYSENVTINGKATEHLFLGTIVFGAVLSAVYLLLLWAMSHTKKKATYNIITGAMAVIVLFEAGYNAFDTIFKIDKEVYYSSKNSYAAIMGAKDVTAKLESIDNGFYRAEKTFFRNVNDNQAYDIKGISHSSSVMNARIIRFIETLGYTTKSYETRYDGNTPVADSLLGIKYVLDDPSIRNDHESLLSPYYNLIESTTYQAESGEKTLDIYENPDALPIGFMADDDILRLSFLGNDNPFNSMNNFLSSLTGSTPEESYQTGLQPRAYFKRIIGSENPEVVLNECWESNYNGQHCYNANAGAGDPTVRIHITVDEESPVYMFLKSDNQKKCNLWVSSTKDSETGEFSDFQGYGSYYDGYDYSIVNIGTYPAGTELEVRLTILQQDRTGNNEYIMVKDFQFYHFDYDAFHEDIQKLKQNTWNLDMEKTKDNRLVGEIDAQAGQVFYTSIPYEPGWTVKVDGKKIDECFEETFSEDGTSIMRNFTQSEEQYSETGQVVILNALMGIRLPEGHHTIEMKYSPPGFNLGVILLIFGIGAVVVFFMWDRKNNQVYALRKQGLEIDYNPPKTEEKKPVKNIIKSKGAVAQVDITAKEEKVDDDELAPSDVKLSEDYLKEADETDDSESEQEESEKESGKKSNKKKK